LAEWQLGGGPPEDTADADLIGRARAALAAEPAGEVPTPAEIDKLTQQHTSDLGDLRIGVAPEDVPALVYAALVRWSCPMPQPIPVSERLPGEGDCDAEGRCWIGTWSDIDGEPTFDWAYTSPRDWTWEGIAMIQYWLPHWALPLPLPQGEPTG
jgi:hypothetical protein